jgi:5'-nucleotidase
MSRIEVALCRTLSVLVICLTAQVAFGQDFRILVSNDDGIDTPQIAALAGALSELPGVEVIISAPAENQSGSSHASSGGEIEVEQVFRNGQLFGYAVHGRPADAVRWGVKVLGNERPFDLVVSGINQGANVGNVAHLSGTVGSAMEAQYHGIPSIAVSQHTAGVDTEASARFAANLVQRLRTQGFPEGVVISVNIPGGEIQGVAVRQMGDSYLGYVGYEQTSGDNSRGTYARNRTIQQATDARSDTWAWERGYITITPLRFDWTDYEYLSELQSWEWEIEP